MAIRNIFSFLLSSEVKRVNVDSGVVMVYHGNWNASKTYKAGSVVRFINGTTVTIYIANADTSAIPDSGSGWDILVNNIVIPRVSMVDSDGLIMIDSNGDTLKVI